MPISSSNNRIDGVNIIESFWVSIWIDCFRFSHTAVVGVDEMLPQILGLKRMAAGTTFGRFFKKFTASMNYEVFKELYRCFFEQLVFDNFNAQVLDYIENKGIVYVMSCKLYAKLQSTIYAIKDRNGIGEELWISEIWYNHRAAGAKPAESSSSNKAKKYGSRL